MNKFVLAVESCLFGENIELMRMMADEMLSNVVRTYIGTTLMKNVKQAIESLIYNLEKKAQLR